MHESVQRLRGRLRFYLNRLRERLWVKPLLISLLTLVVVYVAGLADYIWTASSLPDISRETLKSTLTIIASSMLVIAVFAVGSMLSAYNSASNAATPRSFALVVADDVSQNALSTFIGAFIFSVIALIALLNGYYGKAGRLVLMLSTVGVFIIVVLSFVRWVDRIARLGRMENTIKKVETATGKALCARAVMPALGAIETVGPFSGRPIVSTRVGYVQCVDLAALQRLAETHDVQITVVATPGSFVTAVEPIAYLQPAAVQVNESELSAIADAFEIGDTRSFDDDPRFGLIVLSEIASRALSPAVNDPGTAIAVIGTLVRLFTQWAQEQQCDNQPVVKYARVHMPAIAVADLVDDAFRALARDGAAVLEVGIRLQKALRVLSQQNGPALQAPIRQQADMALRYAEQALVLPEEIAQVRAAADWVCVERPKQMSQPGNDRTSGTNAG